MMRFLAVLLALAGLVAPVLAQDASSASAAPIASSSASAAPPAPAPSAASDGFSFAQVMGSLADPSTESATIAAIDKKTTNVKFVEMHLLADYNAAALTFTAAQSDALKTLHKTIGRNNALMAKLRKAGYLLDDVVAVLADASGAPVVFIDL